MRKTIRKQLESCVYAAPASYDKATRTYFIPRYTAPVYDIGHTYLVRLSGGIVGATDSVTAANWNHGTAPSSDCLRIYVSKASGGMLYVDSVVYDEATGKDTAIAWSGWLPIDCLTQISE